jgi:hypothetical protein
MMLMLNEDEASSINVHHLQYEREDQNQENEWVNNVLMDVPGFKEDELNAKMNNSLPVFDFFHVI